MKDLESALRLYIEVEAIQTNLWHPKSVCLLRTHDALLKVGRVVTCTELIFEIASMWLTPLILSHSFDIICTYGQICMEMKDWTTTLKYCQSTIPAYERTFRYSA